MHIHNVQPGRVRSTDVGTNARREAPAAAGEPRGDQVRISGGARELARQYATEGLTAERIGQLRRQIESGVYPEPQAIEELAWRLIEAGVV